MTKPTSPSTAEFAHMIRSLPDRERAIFVAITFLGANQKELAELHGVSVASLHAIYQEACLRVKF